VGSMRRTGHHADNGGRIANTAATGLTLNPFHHA
jgi:hypothetical protein